ncbi:response regulator [Candidatus Parcubacteria bacterium]|nr:response regulator [Candidatus Parcubacteria bacterium]
MKTIKTIIIEDDINLASALKANLRINGLEANINNGTGEIEGVINYLRIKKPELIILDLILPNIDGFVLLKQIKIEEDLKNTIVAVFSDFSEDDVKKRCYNLGADYFFIKQDFQASVFVEKLLKILKNKKIF